MIHICFNLDNNYVNPCKVLIKGIEAKTKEKITYHFLGLKSQDMETNNICKFYPDLDLTFFKQEHLGEYYYFTQAAMYRLLIPFVIETDKALYLDIDTIILGDIKELYNKEIDYIGAVIDPCSIYHKNRLKIDSDCYYNSGVVLFNSKEIRKNLPDYKERILKAQEDYVIDLKDQDILNIVFKGHITTLDYKYNIDASNLIEKEDTFETIKMKNAAFKNPFLVHCMGKNKWWTTEGLNYGKEWDKNAGKYLPKYRKSCRYLGDMLIVRN